MTDWSRMARPQVDGYDTQQTIELARARYGWTKKVPRPGVSTWLDGAVSVLRNDQDQGPTMVRGDVDHPHFSLTEAWLKDLWPEFYEQGRALLQTVYPFGDPNVGEDPLRTGCSCGPMGDRVGFEISVSTNGGVGMLEGVVHEFGHSKLKALGVSMIHWERLVANPMPTEEAVASGQGDHLFESMIRKDKLRPIGACIHGYYAYLYVAEMLRRLTGSVISYESNAGWLELMATRLEAGAAQIDRDVEPTDEGALFFQGCNDWAADYIGWVETQKAS